MSDISIEAYVSEGLTKLYNQIVDANEEAKRAENRLANVSFDEIPELLKNMNARQFHVLDGLKALRESCENCRAAMSEYYGHNKPDKIERMDGELKYIINICHTVITDRNLSKDFSHIDESTMDKIFQALKKIEQISKQAPVKQEDVEPIKRSEKRVERKQETTPNVQVSDSMKFEMQRHTTYKSYDNGAINNQISALIDFLVKHKEPKVEDPNHEAFISMMYDLVVLAREGRAKLQKNYDASDPMVAALLESYDKLEAYPFVPKGREVLAQIGQEIQEGYSKLNEKIMEQNQEQAADNKKNEKTEETKNPEQAEKAKNAEQTKETKKIDGVQSKGTKKAPYTIKDFNKETGISVPKLQHLGFSKDELRYILAQTNKKDALMPLLSKKIESGEISISDLPRYNAITGEKNDWGLQKKSGESIAKEAIQSLKNPTTITKVEGELNDLEKSKSVQSQAQAPEV